MRVSGFTFLRNAVVNGYPFEESIRSILPIVDEFVCAIGQSDDETRDRVFSIGDPKIRVIDTFWNDSMRDRGFVYGQQKMIAQYNCTGDWAFYLEADEVLHETELSNIYNAMERNLVDTAVEALYFDFLHFYGTPNQVGVAGYRQAPRIIRNSLRAYAPDGLFWVIMDDNKKGRYPNAKSAGGKVYHYGHCRSVDSMKRKVQFVGKYWNRNQDFSGYGMIDKAELREFNGSHPKIMAPWLENQAEHQFWHNEEYRVSFRDYRNRFRFWIENKLKIEISKKHFKALD